MNVFLKAFAFVIVGYYLKMGDYYLRLILAMLGLLVTQSHRLSCFRISFSNLIELIRDQLCLLCFLLKIRFLYIFFVAQGLCLLLCRVMHRCF